LRGWWAGVGEDCGWERARFAAVAGRGMAFRVDRPFGC